VLSSFFRSIRSRKKTPPCVPIFNLMVQPSLKMPLNMPHCHIFWHLWILIGVARETLYCLSFVREMVRGKTSLPWPIINSIDVFRDRNMSQHFITTIFSIIVRDFFHLVLCVWQVEWLQCSCSCCGRSCCCRRLGRSTERLGQEQSSREHFRSIDALGGNFFC
jgi:hypothetical protein